MITVLIAAFNEEHPLASILPRIPHEVNGQPVTVIVVDDGSTDRTADVSDTAGCHTIRLGVNQGKGAALKAGISALDRGSCSALVLMDGDGQHDPDDIPRIAGPVLGGTAHMVVGSRYAHDGGRGSTPWNRYIVRTATVRILRSILRINVSDPFSGFRCVSPDMLDCLQLHGDRYESELEMAFCAARSRLAIVELPIDRVYGPRTSKMGSRLGPILGRINVVRGYGSTILREARADRYPAPRGRGSASTT
ncbi:MAG: glycosyltransferase family 2 protein [Acidimicrobiia bacterium]